MTEYEMRKIAMMQAKYLAEALKSDDDLMDLMFPPRLMNIDEAADFLRIPVNTLYQKVSEIPHEKIGKRLVFTDRSLIRWMKRKNAECSGKSVIEISMSRKAM